MLAYPTGKAKPVEFARHLNIGKDDVNRPVGFDDCLCIVARGGFDNMEAAVPEIVGNVDANEQLVLNDEDRFVVIALRGAFCIRLGVIHRPKRRRLETVPVSPRLPERIWRVSAKLCSAGTAVRKGRG